MIVPGSVNPLLLEGNATACGVPVVTDPPYKIAKSLRFRPAATTQFSKVWPTDGSRTTWTFSVWAKICGGAVTGFYGSQVTGAAAAGLAIDNGQMSFVAIYPANVYQGWVKSVEKFTDPSAWYHFVFVLDTTNAVATDRMRVYANGRRLAVTTHMQISQNNNYCLVNAASNVTHFYGTDSTGAYRVNGYMADLHFIDGQALDASAFGEFNPDNGVWRPKAYTGTYGAHGHWLKFDDAAQIGKDSSGQGNHWTPLNFDCAAPGTQATYDMMKDTPTPFDDGTVNPPGNYCTLNPLKAGGSVLSNGALKSAGAAVEPTMMPETETWYFEVNGVAKTWTPPAAFPAMAGDYNFGQHPFAHPPTGKVLCARNLPYCEPFDKPDGTALHNKTLTLAANEFKYLGYAPTAATGVTWGTQLEKLANGVKAKTAGTYTITNSGERFKTGLAQGNP